MIEFDQNKNFSHKILFTMQSPYSSITNSLYIREVGMIVTTYKGYMEIHDNCDFKSVWNNKSAISDNSTGKGQMSITLVDYSEKLDL